PFAALPLPVALTLDNARIQNIVVQFDETRIPVESVAFTATLADRELGISSLAISTTAPLGQDSPLRSASIEGDLALTLNPLLPLESELHWQIAGDLAEGIDSASGMLTLNGDLQSLQINHQLQTPVLLQTAGN